MKNFYLFFSVTLSLICSITTSSAQNNNLAAGDIAFVSYQSDLDLTNSQFPGGTTNFEDRFSFVVLASGGLPAGTVIYFTDRGWSSSTNDFISGTTEGTIKWVVPAGGIGRGTEVFFISTYIDATGVTSWNAYTNEAGSTVLGTTTTESGSNYMELSTAGDQILAYQTGNPAGTADSYNSTTRRFITAIHGNVETTGTLTTFANWDGPAPAGANRSSVPPGLSNGTTAFLISSSSSPLTEVDNGKYNCTNSNGAACTALQLATTIYTQANWNYNNAPFAIGATSNHCTYSINTPVNIGTQPTNSTSCFGLPSNFVVSATGSGPLTYQWQESADAAFTTPVTLTNSGVYSISSGANSSTLSISDNLGLNGRYYRAVVTGACGAATSSGALLTVTNPTLSAGGSVTQAVNTNNNLYYSVGCGIIDKVVPSGANPVTNNVTSEVWVESTIPALNGQPYAQRHYQVTSSSSPSTATATVTLYFSQGDFDAYNADPASVLDLPTNPSDNVGKLNLRITEFNGTSSNSTGLPGTYSSGSVVIDPADANIVWNATFNRWEVSFDVAGLGGFFVHALGSPLPVTFSQVKAYQQGADIAVEWKVQNETEIKQYNVEKSSDGRTFTSATAAAAKGNSMSTVTYDWLDVHATAGDNFYRIRSTGMNGEIKYSSVIKVTVGTGKARFAIYPNPVTGNVINLNLINQPKGVYGIRLINELGQVLLRRQITHEQGSSTETIPLTNMQKGQYILEIVASDKSKNWLKIMY